MSIVLIRHHNEAIYDIYKKVGANDIPLTGFQLPHSENRARAKVAKDYEKFTKKKKPCSIMGKPKGPLPDPKAFLRKRTGKVFTVDPETVERVPPVKRKADVPRTECAIFEQMNKFRHNKRNFICENVKSVINMKPKEPIRKEYTDARASSFRIIPKAPVQVSNKIFAKIPRYLDKMIKKRQAEIEMINEQKGIVTQKCTYITRDERKYLLEGLKKNWDELQRVYQGLPILTDTIPKRTRKRDLEIQLQELEKDIVLIERHPFIYVYDEEE